MEQEYRGSAISNLDTLGIGGEAWARHHASRAQVDSCTRWVSQWHGIAHAKAGRSLQGRRPHTAWSACATSKGGILGFRVCRLRLV
eukprot:1503059-Rhodomonas_salina.1